jgi:hypothetical protein
MSEPNPDFQPPNVLMKKPHIYIAILGVSLAAILVATLLLLLPDWSAISPRSSENVAERRVAEVNFVARGITAGMSPKEVDSVLGRPKDGEVLFSSQIENKDYGPDKVDTGPEPYAAIYLIRHATLKIPGSNRSLTGLTENFRVYFDDSERATRLDYEVFQKRGVAQQVQLDLRSRTLSEPLKLPIHD